jgi:hypothetical protein
MSSVPLDPITPAAVWKGAALTGLANAVINGAIQAFLLAGHGPVAISVDAIGTSEHTVLGGAVLLATLLAMILTAIGWLTLKAPKRPFLPAGLWAVIRHGFFTFGTVVAAAILWQRFAGTVEVGVPVAVSVLAVVAGGVAAIIHALTITACLEPNR